MKLVRSPLGSVSNSTRNEVKLATVQKELGGIHAWLCGVSLARFQEGIKWWLISIFVAYILSGKIIVDDLCLFFWCTDSSAFLQNIYFIGRNILNFSMNKSYTYSYTFLLNKRINNEITLFKFIHRGGLISHRVFSLATFWHIQDVLLVNV